MRYLLTAFMAVAISSIAAAQSRTETVSYQKINRQAVVAEIPFPEKTVRDAIEDKMQQMGYKGKDVKGFTVYKGVRLSDLGSDSYDLYFAADRKSRKEKDYATLTLMISKGFESFVADSTDSKLINNAKGYIDSIKVMIGAYDLEQQIIAQEDVIKKADKKYTNLIEDGVSLEKKKKNIENDIAENIKSQANKKTDTEKQRQILETLRARRKQ
jgi:hypothetical protein